jgi:hypothetical protein
MFEESGGAMSGQAVAKKDCALEKRISDSDCRIGYHQRHFQSTYIVTCMLCGGNHRGERAH